MSDENDTPADDGDIDSNTGSDKPVGGSHVDEQTKVTVEQLVRQFEWAERNIRHLAKRTGHRVVD